MVNNHAENEAGKGRVTQLLIGWWFRMTRAKTLPIA